MKTETTKKSVAEKRELINHKIKSNIEHNKSTKQNSQDILFLTGLRRLEDDEKGVITNDTHGGHQLKFEPIFS